MVDAINAVNAATHTRINQNRDLAVNWKSLTAKEVLEHAGKGDIVPVEILKWAEDYAKLEDAPDDVSYETVNGATNIDDANEAAGVSDTESAEDSAEETEGENVNSEPKEEEISLYDQAGLLITDSNTSSSNITDIIDDSNKKVEQGERLASETIQKAQTTENQTSSIRAEYSELLRKIEGDKKNIAPEDLLKLDRLYGQLTNIGASRQNEMAVFDLQFQEIEIVFSQYQEMPPVTEGIGNSAIEVGAQLVATSPENTSEIVTAATLNAGSDTAAAALRKVHQREWFFMFDRNYTRGIEAINAGGNAVDIANEGDSVIADANDQINEFKNENYDAEDRVEEATLVESRNIQINNNNNNNNNSINSDKKDPVTKNDPAQKDLNILADDLELQKRKERRGEIKQNEQINT